MSTHSKYRNYPQLIPHVALVEPSFGRLNNLVMIVNCNYQRLDGPVRGNSKAAEI